MRESDVKNRGNSFPTQGENWVARIVRACGCRNGEAGQAFWPLAVGNGREPPTFRKPKGLLNPVPLFLSLDAGGCKVDRGVSFCQDHVLGLFLLRAHPAPFVVKFVLGCTMLTEPSHRPTRNFRNCLNIVIEPDCRATVLPIARETLHPP